MTRRLRIAILLAAALTIAAGLSLYANRGAIEQQVAEAAEIGGPFLLPSARGGMVDSADLLGKPYGVFFGYTHCPEVCPTTMFEMSKALQALGDEAKDFRLFFITVDPERDTAAMLKDYLSNFDPRMEALVPAPAELAAVARQFRAIYAKVPGSDGSYSMDHTATVFLMGRDGKLASTLHFNESAESRIAKLRRLIAGS